MKHLRPIIGWAVFFFLITIVVRALPSPRSAFYFFMGKHHFNSRHFESAVRDYELSVNADPTFQRGYIELGSTYYALEKYPEAEEAFKQALEIQEDACGSCGLGMVYRMEGRDTEAEVLLKRAIELNPSDICPYDQLGRLYYDDREYIKAIAVFTQKNKLKPEGVTYHFLANATYRMGKVEESIPIYRQAANLSPNSERLFVDMGRAYGELGRYAEASKAFTRAIELEPDELQAHALLGVSRFMQRDREAAMEEYRWLLGRDPKVAAGLLKGLEELEAEAKSLSQKKRPH